MDQEQNSMGVSEALVKDALLNTAWFGGKVPDEFQVLFKAYQNSQMHIASDKGATEAISESKHPEHTDSKVRPYGDMGARLDDFIRWVGEQENWGPPEQYRISEDLLYMLNRRWIFAGGRLVDVKLNRDDASRWSHLGKQLESKKREDWKLPGILGKTRIGRMIESEVSFWNPSINVVVYLVLEKLLPYGFVHTWAKSEKSTNVSSRLIRGIGLLGVAALSFFTGLGCGLFIGLLVGFLGIAFASGLVGVLLGAAFAVIGVMVAIRETKALQYLIENKQVLDREFSSSLETSSPISGVYRDESKQAKDSTQTAQPNRGLDKLGDLGFFNAEPKASNHSSEKEQENVVKTSSQLKQTNAQTTLSSKKETRAQTEDTGAFTQTEEKGSTSLRDKNGDWPKIDSWSRK